VLSNEITRGNFQRTVGALILGVIHPAGKAQPGGLGAPKKEPGKMRDLLVDGSRTDGRVVRVSIDAGYRVTAAEVLSDAAFFNPTPKGDYLYRSRTGLWFVGNAMSAAALTPVAALESNFQCEYAALSPSRQSIVWITRQDGVGALLVTGDRGLTPRTIKRGPGIVRVPAWSPQSNAIAYYFGNADVVQTGEFTLRFIQPDGGSDKQIAPPSQPTGITADRTQPPWWSPDGGRVLFVGNYEADNLVRAYAYVVQADGEGLRRIEGGVWSGDGTHLLGVKRTSLPFGPFVLSATEAATGMSHDVRLGFELPASVSNGRWSPDGRLYAFTTNDKQLMLIDVEKKTLVKLIDFAEGANLSWLEPA